jgi:hypothetical protein
MLQDNEKEGQSQPQTLTSMVRPTDTCKDIHEKVTRSQFQALSCLTHPFSSALRNQVRAALEPGIRKAAKVVNADRGALAEREGGRHRGRSW